MYVRRTPQPQYLPNNNQQKKQNQKLPCTVTLYTKALTFENICQAYPPASQHKQADRYPAADTSALRAHSDQVCVLGVLLYISIFITPLYRKT